MEYKGTSEHMISPQDDERKREIFRTLRNIDLNLLTIFEAVYVHKGIVNAAKILNLTPSAISQSIQKLRLIFPDPLFIRKGQGVTPTAYATHLHEYISQGLESILGALDFHGSHNKQRTITIATSPSVGAQVIPLLYSAIQKANPHLLIRNVAITDTETQLSQFQTDLVVDGSTYTSRTIGSHLLFSDRLVMVCREGHPCSQSSVSLEQLQEHEQALITLQNDSVNEIRKRLNHLFPNLQVAFSSYNMVTIAAMISSCDLIGIMPARLFEMFKESWRLREIDTSLFSDDRLDTTLHYNKLSLRDPMMQSVIETVQHAFPAKGR
ncbi:YbeF family transcriptional regulator [Siccibacter turicensis]|uniref:YbeF family transcriptional regulator n=1 Tax=Siccibacter turicensis TaxID=357233 RepID=UPI0023EA7738|nr:YbeF family transcriptional regulator [Siccibacter turicensis]